MSQPIETVLAVVLNWRSAEMTERAMRALARALDVLDAEIVVVDNDSRDGSEEALRRAVETGQWPVPVRVVQSGHNGGYGFGNNVGIRAGRSDGKRPDAVYILNSDAFPDKDAVRALIHYLDAHPEVGLAGSQLYNDEDPHHSSAFRFPTLAGEFEQTARTGPISKLLWEKRIVIADLTRTRQVDWLAGASAMIRQDVLDQIGLFDEDFFLYYEETELFLRARRAGWTTMYVTESRVRHLGSVSTGMKDWHEFPDYWFESRWMYFEKAHGRGYAAAATLARCAGLLVWKLRRLSGAPRLDAPGMFRRLMGHGLRRFFGTSARATHPLTAEPRRSEP